METIFLLPPLVLSITWIGLMIAGAINGLMFWKK